MRECQRQIISAMKLLGKGYAGLNSLIGIMKMRNSNVLKCFNLIIDKIENVSLKIAEDSMNCAAEELNGVSSEDGNNRNV